MGAEGYLLGIAAGHSYACMQVLATTHMHPCRCWTPLIQVLAATLMHACRYWPPLICMHAGAGRHSYAPMQVLAATHMFACRCWPALICMHAGAGRHSYACMQVLAATHMLHAGAGRHSFACMQVLAGTHVHACRCWPPPSAHSSAWTRSAPASPVSGASMRSAHEPLSQTLRPLILALALACYAAADALILPFSSSSCHSSCLMG